MPQWEEECLAVLAVEAVRRMRGGSQSQLMLCADQQYWIVKFQNNPQGIRVLANELIVARLAETIGLSVPTTAIVEVPESVIASTPDMYIQLARGEREEYLPGQHVGSAFAGGLFPGLVVDYLPMTDLTQVQNLHEFPGMLALDKWTGNADGRQAVFHRTIRQKRYRAMFIDQGFCFNAGEWNFLDKPLRGVFQRDQVYAGVTGWHSFEPWLSRIEAIDLTTLLQIADAVPPLWYGGDSGAIEALMKQLFDRKGLVRDLIIAFRDSEREPFPFWPNPQARREWKFGASAS